MGRRSVSIEHGDALDLYPKWRPPTTIVSDGPYGLRSFPGDPPTPDSLPEWYRPHIEAWSRYSTPQTTLWFWNSELGWATLHSLITEHGWEFRNCHVWNKGIGHVAGNSNGKTLRKFPVVTEVCVQYTRVAYFRFEGSEVPMKDWLRLEWERTGLPLYKTNEACGVKNAATRKYFTKDHLWYYPPPDAFEKMAAYANKYGEKRGRPYFSLDGRKPISGTQWEKMRAKFNFENGVSNVWSQHAVRGAERLRRAAKCIHMNQKPLDLIELCVRSSTDKGDVVWEPFGGLCSTAIACRNLGRACYSAEINREYFRAAIERLETPTNGFVEQSA